MRPLDPHRGEWYPKKANHICMKKTSLGIAIALGALLALGAGCSSTQPVAQTPAPLDPAITVLGQPIRGSAISITHVVAPADGWVLVRADLHGAPGAVIGFVGVRAGASDNVRVPLDLTQLTTHLFATLHSDAGELNTLEYPGPDVPVAIQGMPVSTDFTVEMPPAEDLKKLSDPNSKIPRLKIFSLTAKRWQFTPSTITVNLGDEVRLYMTSLDVTHGFSIPELDINHDILPNQTTVLDFLASKKGTFSFVCSVVCGAGHTQMKGTLIVK